MPVRVRPSPALDKAMKQAQPSAVKATDIGSFKGLPDCSLKYFRFNCLGNVSLYVWI